MMMEADIVGGSVSRGLWDWGCLGSLGMFTITMVDVL